MLEMSKGVFKIISKLELYFTCLADEVIQIDCKLHCL